MSNIMEYSIIVEDCLSPAEGPRVLVSLPRQQDSTPGNFPGGPHDLRPSGDSERPHYPAWPGSPHLQSGPRQASLQIPAGLQELSANTFSKLTKNLNLFCTFLCLSVMLTEVGPQVYHHSRADVAGPERGEAGLRGRLLSAGGRGGTLGQDKHQVRAGQLKVRYQVRGVADASSLML